MLLMCDDDEGEGYTTDGKLLRILYQEKDCDSCPQSYEICKSWTRLFRDFLRQTPIVGRWAGSFARNIAVPGRSE